MHDHFAAPTPAERVLSVLAAADSLTLHTDGHHCQLTGLHRLDGAGRLLLQAPVNSHVVVEVAVAPDGWVAARLAFTDIAPVAVRDRVRARVAVRGRLSFAAEEPVDGLATLRLDPVHVELVQGARTTTVGIGDLAAAEPDPMAAFEATTLTHLEAHHPETVALLTRLLDPWQLHRVRRVCPLALDRYGLVLRLENPGGHRDVRLPFAGRAADVAGIEGHIGMLLLRARGCPRRHHRRSPKKS